MTRIEAPQSDNPWVICSAGLCQIDGFELIPDAKLDELNSLLLGFLKREVQIERAYEANKHRSFLPVCEDNKPKPCALAELAKRTFATPTPERNDG